MSRVSFISLITAFVFVSRVFGQTPTPTPSLTPTPTPSPSPRMAPHSGTVLGTQAFYGMDSAGNYRPILVDSTGYLLIEESGVASSVSSGLVFTAQTELPATENTLAVSTTGILWFTSTDPSNPIQVAP